MHKMSVIHRRHLRDSLVGECDTDELLPREFGFLHLIGQCGKFFNCMKENGYAMDTAGISYYPSAPSLYLNKEILLKKTVTAINKKCGLPVFIGEFSYPSSEMSGPFAGWNKETKGYAMDQDGQAALYADVIAWGKTHGLIGIRYWAPDFEGWYAMSMFTFNNQVGTAKAILETHSGLIR